MTKIIRSYPKIFLVPFIAMVLFFSILIFVLITLPVHLTTFSVPGTEYGFFRDSASWLWMLSALLGVPVALFYLGRVYDHTNQGKGKKKKEEAGAIDLLFVFLMGLPFGYFVSGFVLFPESVFFTMNGMLIVFAFPVVLSLISWFALNR